MDKKIYVFTLNGCIHCTNLKKLLKENSINFLELDVYENEEFWEKIVEITNEDILPTILIKNSDVNTGVVLTPGIDFFSEKEAIDIIKKHTAF